MYIIKEAVYGNMATVFHRTSVSDLVNKIFDSGFKPGGGDMYGKGFYSTYELESQLRANMIKTYGPIIVKFACPIQTFFIFDYDEFKKSPNFNKLKRPSKDDFLIEQFKFFKMDYSKFNQEEVDFNYYSSAIALWCFRNIKNFTKLCEGIIYTGQHDGRCLLAYNTKLIMPLSYTLDEGRNWEKVELNLDYLKKIAKVKNRFFIPDLTIDLTIKPEDFKINNYDFDSNGFLNTHKFVNLTGNNLTSFPFKFGIIGGDFDCSDNNLASLEGAPKEVGGDFDCSDNNLTSLKGAPEKVDGNFYCSYNNLTSLKGAPEKVDGNFYCSNNKINFTKEDVEKVCEVGGLIYV